MATTPAMRSHRVRARRDTPSALSRGSYGVRASVQSLPAKKAHPEGRFLGASFVVTARRTQPELHDGSPRNARNGLGAGRVALQSVFGRALLLPVAMLGATAGIVLGLLGAGQ